MSIKIKGNPLMCPTDTAAIQAAVDTANGAASAAATAQSTAQAAQASADGKVAKSGDTMTGGLGIGKASATDTSDGCYFGTGGTMYFRRTNGNPFIAFYKGSGDKRQFLQGVDVSADTYLSLPTAGGTLAITADITNRIYSVNINAGETLVIPMSGYGTIRVAAVRNGDHFVFYGNTFPNGVNINGGLNLSGNMTASQLSITNNAGAMVKLQVIKG